MNFAKPVCVGFFVALCLEALFSIGYRGTFLLTHSYLLAWAAAAVVFGITALCYRFRQPLFRALGRLFPATLVASNGWAWAWLAVGLVLRIGWVLPFPVVMRSDAMAYYLSAQKMTAHSYTGAYWPPGLPLLLAPMMMIFGVHPWVTVLLALLLFVATYATVWFFARELAGRRAAGIAVALLALWPGYATIAGINTKEALLAWLLPLSMLLYCLAVRNDAGSSARRWTFLVAAGLVAGYCALTQPGCLLFPVNILMIEVLRRSRWTGALLGTIGFGLAMLLAILPWTYRNHVVLHRDVLISVNGGDTFYIGNNPTANASYESGSSLHLPVEVFEANRVGYLEGRRWIREHPAAFLKLAVRKQIVFFGEDGTGVYETLRRDQEPPRLLYAGLKGITSVFWLGFWLVLLAGLRRLLRLPLALWFGVCFLPLAYQWLIDSVYISVSRHHLCYVGFFAVLLGWVLVTPEGRDGVPAAATAVEA